MSNHTPGPWYAMGAGIYTGSLQNDDIAHIATAHFYGVPGDAMANARLIAAAPDLLQALEWLLTDPHSERGTHTAITYARAVISRATGEA